MQPENGERKKPGKVMGKIRCGTSTRQQNKWDNICYCDEHDNYC